MPKKKQRTSRKGMVMLAVFLLVLVVSGLSWYYAAGLRIHHIEILGARHADADALREIARVDTGMVLLDLDPVLLADRLRHHPWVAEAAATRLPDGTLLLDVTERVPAALALGADGTPAFYLDASGFMMPLAKKAAYDVPLVHGLAGAYHATRPAPAPVAALLAALKEADPTTRALVSDIEVRPDGELWLHARPPGAGPAIPVQLGRDGFGPRLRRLAAFWEQAVVTQPDRHFARIDLRFDSQVVTRETAQ